MKMKYLPNIISTFRIMATIGLLFMDAFTTGFFVIYVFAGISDALDGWIARKTNNTSEFGAKLDSIADLLYYTVMALKIFPVLLKTLSKELWCMLVIVLVLRVVSYSMAALKYGRFASLHTYMNKCTGGAVFLMPFVIKSPIAIGFCTAAGIVAILAAVEELVIHFRNREYNANVKSLLWRRNCEQHFN